MVLTEVVGLKGSRRDAMGSARLGSEGFSGSGLLASPAKRRVQVADFAWALS